MTGNEKWYSNFLMPCIRLFGAETAHWLAIKAAKYKLVPHIENQDNPSLVSAELSCDLEILRFLFIPFFCRKLKYGVILLAAPLDWLLGLINKEKLLMGSSKWVLGLLRLEA